jgi:hypothetical protein
MRWEYLVREFSVQEPAHIVLLEELLNEVGKDGWNLVRSHRRRLQTSRTSFI